MTKRKTIKLEDLAPRTSAVDISGGRALEVEPLGVGDIAALFIRFPALGEAMSGKLKVADLAAVVPEAVPAIISAGSGADPAKAEKLARALQPSDQLLVLTGILEATFPEGMGPFLEALEALGGKAEKLAPEDLAAKLMAETAD